jgi:hypothetical protein
VLVAALLAALSLLARGSMVHSLPVRATALATSTVHAVSAAGSAGQAFAGQAFAGQAFAGQAFAGQASVEQAVPGTVADSEIAVLRAAVAHAVSFAALRHPRTRNGPIRVGRPSPSRVLVGLLALALSILVGVLVATRRRHPVGLRLRPREERGPPLLAG